MMRTFSTFLLVLLHIYTVKSACVQNSAAHDTEQLANAVEMKLYRATISEWNSKEGSAVVAVQVSSAANTYCAANPGTCGVTSCCTDAFKDLNIGVVAGFPQMEKKDMLLKIYVDLPTGLNASGTPECVVNAAALRSIVGDARQGIYDATGYWITYVDTDFYGIPPDKELNSIIIPIACVVVLLLYIITMIIHFVDKKRQHRAKMEKRIADRARHSKSKVSPTYDLPEEPKHTVGLSEKNSGQRKPQRKNQLYKDNLKRSVTKNASIHSEDSAIKSDTEPRSRHGYVYEKDGATGYDGMDTGTKFGHLKPLQTETEVSSPEKKKKKKKKRSKSKENKETANYEDTDGLDE